MRTTTLVTITCLFTLAALGNTWADETGGGFAPDKVQSMEVPMEWPSALREMMIERRKASIEGDVDRIARSTADEYLQTDISGYRQDKRTWLTEYFEPLASLIRAGKFRWTRYEHKGLELRLFGDCAIVTGRLEAEGQGAKWGPDHTWVADPNASFSGTLHFTQVYIRRDGKWLLAGLQNAVPVSPPVLPPNR